MPKKNAYNEINTTTAPPPPPIRPASNKIPVYILLLTSIGGCASTQSYWEDFRSGDLERLRSDHACAVALGYEPPVPDECLKASWIAIRAMEQNQECRADADCVVLHSWPPVGPCCTAVRRAWLRSENAILLEREVEHACGSVNRICTRASSCKSRCIEGQCVLRNPEPYLLPADAPCAASSPPRR